MWRGQRASNAIKSEGLRLQVDVAMEIKKGGGVLESELEA